MWAAHLGHKGCLKEFHLVVGQQERTANHLSRREGRRGLETRPRVTELSEGCVLSVVAVTLFRTKRERERERDDKSLGEQGLARFYSVKSS